LFTKIYTDVYTKKMISSLLGNSKSNNYKILVKEKINETKSIVEDWIGGPMTKSQLVEFNSLNNNALAQVQFTMGLVSTMLKNSGSSSSSSSGSKSSTFNAWQCSGCAAISHLDREPCCGEFGGYKGCNGGMTHHWRQVNTKSGWQCSGCGTISHIDREPCCGEFGGYKGCNGGMTHHWRQF
jgi:hypothetical protein